MDNEKVGSLIGALRREKGLTQKELADSMHISDKTVSKWERGLGCPEVSLLGEVASRLGISVETLLSGDLEPKETDGGNMKRIKFYVCPECGNILTATGAADCCCCGRTLTALKPLEADSEHQITMEEAEDETLLCFQHDMKKDHYISFAACVSWDRVLFVRLYPEQEPQVRMPQMRKGSVYYFYCTKHGLFTVTV